MATYTIPPFSNAMYGNLQTFPSPTARPREERKNSIWLPQDSRSSAIFKIGMYDENFVHQKPLNCSLIHVSVQYTLIIYNKLFSIAYISNLSLYISNYLVHTHIYMYIYIYKYIKLFNLHIYIIHLTKEMISRLKCNFLRNQEEYAIYEYTICLLILKS